MKIKFIGATEGVTGSKLLLLTEKGKQILLDCGLYQGMGKATDELIQGAADPRFANVIRIFAGLFPGRRFGGGPWPSTSTASLSSTSGRGGPIGTGSAVDRQHRCDGVLGDKGCGRYGGPPARRPRPAGLRHPRRRVLAGVRRERQVRHHRSRRAAAPGRPVAPERRDEGGPARPPPDGGAVGRSVRSITCGEARISRADVRMAGIGRVPSGHGLGHARPHSRRGGALRSTPTACTSAARPPGRRRRWRRSWSRRTHGPIRCSTSSHRGWQGYRSRVRSARCTSPASDLLCRAIFRSSTGRCLQQTASSPAAASPRCTRRSPTAERSTANSSFRPR